MKIKEILQSSTKRLEETSSTPRLDSEIILEFVLRKNKEFFYTNPEHKISKKQLNKFFSLLKERQEHKPVAYLTKEKFFMCSKFKVSEKTLIPRPETEILVEKIIKEASFIKNEKTTLIDVGTGSGCIIISLILELAQKTNFSSQKNSFYAVDNSEKAIKIAKENWKNLKEKSLKIKFLKGNLLEPLTNQLKKDKNNNLIIAANLPYLSKKIYENCPISVKNFEPKEALIAKKKGLGLYIELLKQIKFLNLKENFKKIYLIFEISPEQKPFIKKQFVQIFPNIKIKLSKDFSKKWRFVEILL